MRNVPTLSIWAISTASPGDKRDLNYDKYFKDGDTQRNVLTEFNSNNTELLNVEQVQQKLLSLSYIREELEAMKNK